MKLNLLFHFNTDELFFNTVSGASDLSLFNTAMKYAKKFEKRYFTKCSKIIYGSLKLETSTTN